MNAEELEREEIELMKKLVKDETLFSKNKNFTGSHREACRTEGKIFKRILVKLDAAQRTRQAQRASETAEP